MCPRGETDITTGFGPVIGGSNPSEDKRKFKVQNKQVCFSLRSKWKVKNFGIRIFIDFDFCILRLRGTALAGKVNFKFKRT